MITFNDIKMSDEKSTVYIPRRLRDCFCDFLKIKCPDVQYDTISRWEIPGSDFETARNDFTVNIQECLLARSMKITREECMLVLFPILMLNIYWIS